MIYIYAACECPREPGSDGSLVGKSARIPQTRNDARAQEYLKRVTLFRRKKRRAQSGFPTHTPRPTFCLLTPTRFARLHPLPTSPDALVAQPAPALFTSAYPMGEALGRSGVYRSQHPLGRARRPKAPQRKAPYTSWWPLERLGKHGTRVGGRALELSSLELSSQQGAIITASKAPTHILGAHR